MTKRSIFDLSWGLIAPVFILIVLSLVTLFSINADFFKSQFIYLIISILVFFVFSQINYKVLDSYSLPIYILSLVSLFFVLILGIQSRGAIRWIDIVGLKIQFSEIIKPFLLIAFSFFLSKRTPTFNTFLITICLLLPILFFIYKQPDLGNTIIFLVTTIFILIFFGFPLKWFFSAMIFILISLPLVWRFMHDYQRQRVLSFIYPNQDPLDTSYNSIQSIIAVGSGSFLGKGFSQGTQSGLRFLPERHTDFIFATISENLGFIGSLTIILCFAFFLYRLYIIFKNNSDVFSKIFIASSFFLILVQLFFNIGMNIGILPIVGITLPFVSSGGSSLLSNFILLAFLSSIDKASKNKNVLEIK